MVMTSDFGPKEPLLNTDIAKEPTSAQSVHACKFFGSKNTIIGLQKFTTDVVSEKKFSPLQTQNKIAEEEMNGSVMHRQKLKLDSCHWKWDSFLRRHPPLP